MPLLKRYFLYKKSKKNVCCYKKIAKTVLFQTRFLKHLHFDIHCICIYYENSNTKFGHRNVSNKRFLEFDDSMISDEFKPCMGPRYKHYTWRALCVQSGLSRLIEWLRFIALFFGRQTRQVGLVLVSSWLFNLRLAARDWLYLCRVLLRERCYDSTSLKLNSLQ